MLSTIDREETHLLGKGVSRNVFNFEQTRALEKDKFQVPPVILQFPRPATLLDLTVSTVAGPTSFTGLNYS
jgi:hypothetical protein